MRCRDDFAGTHSLCHPKPGIEGVIAIADEVSGRLIPGEGFAQLLNRPRCGGMLHNGHEHDAPALVGENHEDEQQTARHGRYYEEVCGHDLPNVVRQKGAPGLGHWPPAPDHVLRDRVLRDVNSEFQQFAVDSRRAPERKGF